MTLFAIAAWLVGIACGAIIAAGFYAISSDRPEHHAATGVCTPSRHNTLTGAHAALDRRDQMIRERDIQIDALQQQCEELEDRLEFVDNDGPDRQEVERLRQVIRQRNRTIKQLQSEMERQPVEQLAVVQPVATVGTVDRFEWLEIRGQS